MAGSRYNTYSQRQSRMIKKTIILLALSCIAALSHAEDLLRVPPNDVSNKAHQLDLACRANGKFSYDGFCLSRAHGKTTWRNPTQDSITLGLEIASLELFYSNCEHSDFPSLNEAVSKAKSLLRTRQFYDEVRTQGEALNNYTRQLYSCKSRNENDATISSRIKWLNYMSKIYTDNKIFTSNNPAVPVVDCILSKYKGSGSDFFAAGIPAQNGSITISLVAPILLPLATVTNMGGGSSTQLVNADEDHSKLIPKQKDFADAVIDCQ